MANSDQLLQRNKDFAASCAHEEASIIVRHPACVITCLDPQTDPSAVRSGAGLPRSATVLPDTITVSGDVYDVATGLVATIIPAAPMPPACPASPQSQQEHLPRDA